jgi:pimeloyl-ACP methyl ester carboxylesterase
VPRTIVLPTLAILPALLTSACGAVDDSSFDGENGAPEVRVASRALEASADGSASSDLSAALGVGADLPLTSPRLRCADLAAKLSLNGVVLTKSEEVAASSGTPSYPAHCLVGGQIDARTGSDGKPYAIGFELRMPLSSYRGRFFFQGGSGTDGVLNPAFGDLLNTATTNALSLGYAVVSTDGGHNTGQTDVSFGLEPQARIDYGYNAVGRTTQVGKSIVARYYGSAPRRSYFVGCSNGGRQAMVAASRFADQFDGIVAAAPGMNLPQAALAQAWDTQQFFFAGPPGQLPKDTFPPAAMASVAAGVIARCDALDGLADGMVNDLEACKAAFQLDRDVATCTTPSSTNCLSAAQKTALANVFAGVKNTSGTNLYANWPFDPGVSGGGWRFWKLDAGFAPLPFNTIIGSGALGYIFTTPPDAPDLSDAGLGYQLSFNFDVGGPKIFATNATFTQSAMQFMTPPDPTHLTRFRNRGGKLLVVHGSADPVFSANDTIAWYRALVAADLTAGSYARLFLVPGMNHCSGGPATDRFNMLSALQSWVEAGTAPSSVVAAVDPANPDVLAQGWSSSRTRPLCPYPKRAIFTHILSNPEAASSFTCL